MEQEPKKTNYSKNSKLVFTFFGVVIALLIVCIVMLSCILGNKKEQTDAFTVFYSSNGKNVATKLVKKGEDVSNVPSVPDLPGYSGKWSEDGKNVQKDTVIYAIYTPNTYNITFTLDKISIEGETPTTILGGTSIDIAFKSEIGYTFPKSIAVSGSEYTWNEKYGLLRVFNPIDNVKITIGWAYAPQKVHALELAEYEGAYIKIGNNEKIYFDSTRTIDTTIIPGDKIYLYSPTACILEVKKTNIITEEETFDYQGTVAENELSKDIFAGFGYSYYLELGWDPSSI